MSEKQGPPLILPPTDVRGEDGKILLETTYVGVPKPGTNSQSGGFRVPPTDLEEWALALQTQKG